MSDARLLIVTCQDLSVNRFAATALLVLVLALSGCAGSPDAVSTTNAAATETRSATPTLTPTPTPATATELADAIKLHVASVRQVVTLTEDNDPNDLIGRPTGYSDGAVLYDANVTCDELGVGCGATIEIWPDGTSALARSDYIQGILTESPVLGTEYNYISGSALLRVAGDVKPSLAAEYEAAFLGATR